MQQQRTRTVNIRHSFELFMFLVYSYPTILIQYYSFRWCNQIIDFLETIVLPSYQNGESKDDNGSSALPTTTTRVHLVGNSVGGHLAAHVAVRRPDLVASLCLLNPTPVWGSKLPGWNGYLPAPTIPKAVGRYLFDRIRDLKTIDQFLTATYSRRQAFTDDLVCWLLITTTRMI